MAVTQARWADLRFYVSRLLGLVRRARTSLRTRGLRATFERIAAHLRPAPAAARASVYLPAPAPFTPFTLPSSDAPVASIVVPVYGQIAHTLTCLRAIAAHPPRTAFEVVVVDDGSPDDTARVLANVEGLRFHRRAANGGFIAACNDGAALARGEYVVFLNNDTVPQPGWLDELLGTFATHPDTGLVGAQLLYPDGRLQECGGIVFSDASAWNVGRFGDPSDPRYSYVREVDYCSGAAIAIRRALFEEIGGFDARYAPAYYEDTDLAFAVRERGLKVRVQPFAKVVHVEGATAGTDETRGAKAYQVRNRGVFAAKWSQALQRQPKRDDSTPPQLARGTAVLVVDALTPDPTRDSGSVRLVNIMRLLLREGAHVTFLAANRRHDGVSTQALQRLGVEVWFAPHAGRPPVWLKQHAKALDVALVCRHYVAREFLPLLRRHAPRARVLFDTVDLHYLRERRGALVTGDPALARAAEATRQLELQVVRGSDVTLVVSEAERRVLADDAPGARVEVLSNVHELGGRGRPYAERRGLVFVGGFRHPPNVDAVAWFVRDVFPLIRRVRPDLEFHCIGSDAPPAVLALAGCDGVTLHGHVPDLSPFMDGARIAVAPLRFGAGVKGKVNLSMAHGQPVVATSCTVEGMHLRDGEDVLVADDPQAFADAVLRLYGDEALWNRLAANGLDNVARHFSMDAARGVVRQVILGLPG
ncbi:glycosyltransferase [Lysobacter sp. N42]|uniref:glycosyltransferase n=1 Tax=Lysobacter sp. N42 TaxID=2545719 RepID=UPI001045B1D2|nr:glycosyltransferase [Lysobacter sp. N42]TCZ84960.1 glycosyltransferase [Lysobacter sp. N42]